MLSPIKPILSDQPTFVSIVGEISKYPSNSVISCTSHTSPLLVPSNLSSTCRFKDPLTTMMPALTSISVIIKSVNKSLFLLNGSLLLNSENDLVASNLARSSDFTIWPKPGTTVAPIPGLVVNPV